jgi:uncharacterized coiled-coil protein SlyX
VELTKRIRRRKEEREWRINEQRMKEIEIMVAEQSGLIEEAEAEKLAHKLRIKKLEAELMKTKCGQEQEVSENEHSAQKKRDRSVSLNSRNEFTARSAFDANILNLPAGYRAVRSTKLNSLAVRHLNGGSAIPFHPIGSFANDQVARIRLANTISDSKSSRTFPAHSILRLLFSTYAQLGVSTKC